MTSEERAEKILNHSGIDMFWDYDDALAFTVTQIREAVEEALGDTVIPLSVAEKNANAIYQKAKAEAYEDAAKIVEDWGAGHYWFSSNDDAISCERMVSRIRARAMEIANMPPTKVKTAKVKQKLQVWWIPQVPTSPFNVPVDSVEMAIKILDTLAEYDKFQLDNNIKPDYSNAGGLNVWEDGEWLQWENEDGQSVDGLMRERTDK